MASLASLMARLEPTTGLVEYVQTVKPYHSKILDVSVEYVYTDNAIGWAVDSHTMAICLTDAVLPGSVSLGDDDNSDCDECCPIQPPVQDVEYSCGYGRVWDTIPEPIVTYRILDVILADETVRLSNAFVVQTVAPEIYNVSVVAGSNNRLRFVNSFNVLASSPLNQTVTIAGTPTLEVGETILVEFTVTSLQNLAREYTIVDTFVVGGNTVIEVDKSIPSQTISAKVNTYIKPYDIPRWAYRNAKVRVVGPDYDNELFLIPTLFEDQFNLSLRRNPREFKDYLTFEEFVGPFEIELSKVELYQPGQLIRVQSTQFGINDGDYTVAFSEEVAGLTYVVVNQNIRREKDPATPYDGVLYYVEAGFSEPETCAMASAPDLYGRATAIESLFIDFELTFIDVATNATAIENPPTNGFASRPYGNIQKWDSDVANVHSTAIIVEGGLPLAPSGYDTTTFGNVPFDIMTF